MEYLSRCGLAGTFPKRGKDKRSGNLGAAASSGEEPYMLPMPIGIISVWIMQIGIQRSWQRMYPLRSWSRRRRGIYTADAIASMPAQWKRRYF